MTSYVRSIYVLCLRVNNPYPCHPYMFITENYSSKFTIMSFWAPALKFLAVNGIPQKSLIRHLHHILDILGKMLISETATGGVL